MFGLVVALVSYRDDDVIRSVAVAVITGHPMRPLTHSDINVHTKKEGRQVTVSQQESKIKHLRYSTGNVNKTR